jgi:hypothetical protein
MSQAFSSLSCGLRDVGSGYGRLVVLGHVVVLAALRLGRAVKIL